MSGCIRHRAPAFHLEIETQLIIRESTESGSVRGFAGVGSAGAPLAVNIGLYPR
jgi:hypothetical protein